MKDKKYIAGRTTFYYYVGGIVDGEWRETLHGSREEMADQMMAIMRMGYVCVPGDRMIGAPEGAPSRKRLDDAMQGFRSKQYAGLV